MQDQQPISGPDSIGIVIIDSMLCGHTQVPPLFLPPGGDIERLVDASKQSCGFRYRAPQCLIVKTGLLPCRSTSPLLVLGRQDNLRLSSFLSFASKPPIQMFTLWVPLFWVEVRVAKMRSVPYTILESSCLHLTLTRNAVIIILNGTEADLIAWTTRHGVRSPPCGLRSQWRPGHR
jgi:hypothetical protein